MDLPANLRFLRVLVTTLAITMIAGLLTIVGLLVMRFSAQPDPETVSAAAISQSTDLTELTSALTLPDGTQPRAVTLTEDLLLVVTTAATLLIYDRASGTLRQTVALK